MIWLAIVVMQCYIYAMVTAIVPGITEVPRFYLSRWRDYSNNDITWENYCVGIQSVLVQLCDVKLKGAILRGLYDFLAHTASFRGLLDNLKKFFQICRDHNLKLHCRTCEPDLT